jgi:hypothetical protein
MTECLIPDPPLDDLERALLARSPRFQQMVAEARAEYQQGQTLPEDVFWEQVLSDKRSEDEAGPDRLK